MGDTIRIAPEIEASASLWGPTGQFSLLLGWDCDSGCSQQVVRLRETVGGWPTSGGFWVLLLFLWRPRCWLLVSYLALGTQSSSRPQAPPGEERRPGT